MYLFVALLYLQRFQPKIGLECQHSSPIFGPNPESGQLHHHYLFSLIITIIITYKTIIITFIIALLLLHYNLLLR